MKPSEIAHPLVRNIRQSSLQFLVPWNALLPGSAVLRLSTYLCSWRRICIRLHPRRMPPWWWEWRRNLCAEYRNTWTSWSLGCCGTKWPWAVLKEQRLDWRLIYGFLINTGPPFYHITPLWPESHHPCNLFLPNSRHFHLQFQTVLTSATIYHFILSSMAFS